MKRFYYPHSWVECIGFTSKSPFCADHYSKVESALLAFIFICLSWQVAIGMGSEQCSLVAWAWSFMEASVLSGLQWKYLNSWNFLEYFRCVPIVYPDLAYKQTIGSTLALLSTNVLYSGIFALGNFTTIVYYISTQCHIFSIMSWEDFVYCVQFDKKHS